jgi:uncharacterized protein YbaR (Trm112 family)
MIWTKKEEIPSNVVFSELHILVCPRCNTTFYATRRKTIYCSRYCLHKAYNNKIKAIDKASADEMQRLKDRLAKMERDEAYRMERIRDNRLNNR